MTLTTRQPLLPCGKPYATEEEALSSKRGRGGGFGPHHCDPGCGRWHLHRLPVGTRTVKPAARKDTGPSRAETFGPVACLHIDVRDSEDSTGNLVRLCQRCGNWRGLHRHHRRAKQAGGSSRAHTHCECNGVTLCRDCHAEVHAHPEQAMAEGWIVLQAEDEPGSVGVMRFAAAEGGATQWPSCDGRWLETAPEAREAA